VNRYKGVIWFLKAFLWCVTLGIIISLALPIVEYTQKPNVNMNIEMDVESASSGIRWMLDHNKISVKNDSKPDVMYISDISASGEAFESRIDGNIFVGEMIMSQLGGDQERVDFYENLVGVKYTGFVGNSYRDLSDIDEVPLKAIELYEATTGESWKFYGKGIVISDNKNIIVLEEGKDYIGDVHVMSDGKSEIYSGPFEILESFTDSDQFEIKATASGVLKLDNQSLKANFPALVQVKTRLYDGYYFAGEFSRIPVQVPYAFEQMPNIMKNKLIYDSGFDESLYWKWYYPKMTALIDSKKEYKTYVKHDSLDDNLFYVKDQKIMLKDSEDNESEFFIKGVNLGAALPGKTFTEFPMDKATYALWLEQMGSLNINTLRVYTLLPPVFYEALHDYNEKSESPIYLLQEIWPEEYPEEHNYLGEEYNKTYRREIEYAVHAIHGNINIPKRQYRSYGLYKHDISEYVIGYLVGREMEPEEVVATDEINEGYTFKGRFLYSEKDASPTEAWLASACDYTLRIEDMFYSDSPLVAIVSWPTLDPQEHDSEWNSAGDKSKQYNDRTVVDINNIGIRTENVSGFFGAYHIYPNYPDFMNNDVQYDAYSDDQGRFRYGGYLESFMEGHKKYPAVVAEYGISSSMVTAHMSPDGYHHGGLSEEQQAEGIIRMTDAIIREEYAGAIIFEWMDEWAKKTWTTEPYMIPYDNNPFWHNVLDPEQNYGLLAIESTEPLFEKIDLRLKADSRMKAISVAQNEAYVYFKFELNTSESVDFSNLEDFDPIEIGIDTIKEDNEIYEYLLRIDNESKLLVNPGYNWLKGSYRATIGGFEMYEDLIQVINKENLSKNGEVAPEKSINLSELKYGDFTVPQNHIEAGESVIVVRLPYGLLALSDPKSNLALSDDEKIIPVVRDSISTESVEDIGIWMLDDDVKASFTLKRWDMPSYEVRFKAGVEAIAKYFDEIE